MKTMALTDDAILEAATVIRSGGTVVYPTETAYALGADPFNTAAVGNVFALKGRSENKPLGLIAASREQVEEHCVINPVESQLMDHYWPGALSIVLPIRAPQDAEREAFMHTTAGWDTVSIRVSGSPWARKLAEAVGRPIIATSANISGGPNCFTVGDLAKQFSGDRQPDLLLDGGDLPASAMSTLVAVQEGKPVVLRQGAVRLSE
ncbi:MAG: threonylcarbamoyl-AMP synthase [Candidatus Kerfeldbacteria bacterium]|nr:threonylcarbamoyl-AMP synthase [Candidatus Kerfeldbacteria bacterium]